MKPFLLLENFLNCSFGMSKNLWNINSIDFVSLHDGNDEPKTLPYAMTLKCPISDDVRQLVLFTDETLEFHMGPIHI